MRSDPSLALQKTIRARLIASPNVLALVPASNVLDTHGRPAVMPAVIIGEGQTVIRRFYCTTYATIHGWISEPGLAASKELGGAIVGALSFDALAERAVLHLDGFDCHDLAVTNLQYLRDPHLPCSHVIVTLAGVMKEQQS